MIVVDTGPLIAFFDPKDPFHAPCVAALERIRESMYTTTAVLTEAFHMLQPQSVGAERLREFVEKRGVLMWFFDRAALLRAFELMDTYADHAMDFADASLVVAAESLGTRKVFTVDRNDFLTYRVRRGHRHLAMELVL